ncbi:hypothetical protein BKI52_33915 [marine bacterium AO1-C]|nr:hypothetical protein BKI52_33915 [marine bacterium AO1-C]
MPIIVFFISILALEHHVQAQPVFKLNTIQDTYSYPLNSYIQIFEDSLGLFNIDQVASKPFASRFSPLSQTTLRNARSVYWLKISLKNNLSQDTKWILHVGYINEATLFTPKPNKGWSSQKSGKFVPISQQEITEGRDSQFSILLKRNTTHTYFLKVANVDARLPRIQANLHSYYRWHRLISRRNLVQGLFHGFLWVLALYYVFIYLVMKENVYIHFSLYIVCNSIYFLSVHGFLNETIFGEAPRLNEFAWYATVQFAFVAYFQLLRGFFHTKAFIPRWDKIVSRWSSIRLISIPIGLIILLVTFNVNRINWIIICSILIDIALSLVVLWKLRTQPVHFLGYFFFGILLYIIGVVTTIVIFLQDTSASILTQPIQAGICLQLLCYAIGLGMRFRYNELQKREHQKILISELKAHQEIFKQVNRDLEEKVEERTQEVAAKNTRLEAQNHVLQEQKDRLESLNNLKAKLFSIISHDLRSPINSIQGVLHLMNSDALSQEEVKMLSKNLNNQVQITQNLLDNLLYWSKLQMQGLQLNNTQVNLFQVVDNTLHLFRASNPKSLDIQNYVREDLEVWADANMLALVIRNLVANAMKFTPEKGQVIVDAQPIENQFIKIAITDTGIGITPEDLPKIFDLKSHFTKPGTSQEKGTGLGLMLCKEFVEKQQGSIWVESVLHQGSSFYFTLPVQPFHKSQPHHIS